MGGYTGTSMIVKPITDITVVDTVFIQFKYMLLDTFPTLAMLSATGVTSSAATLSANVIDTQRVNVTSRGVCWGTTPEPVLGEGNYIADTLVGEGEYSIRVTGLQRGTQYYARAYAINPYCTTYSTTTVEFSTLTGAPILTSRSANNITVSSATLRGRIEDSVDARVTRYGFMVSMHQSFDTVNTPLMIYEANNLDNTNNFSFPLTDLTEYTTYYVRAFAENSYGIGMGSTISFTTDFEPIENNEISGAQAYCGLENRQPVEVEALMGSEPSGRTAPYTYLWQYKTLTTSWADATGTNNEINYAPGTLSDSTYFRRIVFATGIYDTSNTVLIAVNYSHGGNISFTSDTVNVNEKIGRLRIQNNKGEVVQWERKYEDNEWIVIAGSSSSIFDTLKHVGNYIYRVKIQFGDCLPVYSAEKTIYAKGEVSILTAENDMEVSFVPNPSTGIFTIMASSDEIYSVKVLSLDGKVCYEETDVNISGKRMDLTNLPNGAYIVNIANDKAQVSKKIVIKK